LAALLGRADGPADGQLAGLGFLDLFAGTGAVGLEAASRGAGPVRWVEKDPAAARLIDRCRSSLGASGQVSRADVGALLAAPAPAPFDLVWLDPPYAFPTAAVDRLTAAAWANGWLAADGLLLVERSGHSDAPSLAGFRETWVRRYGDTRVFFARQATEGNP
jgi:16S rRNA (guanine966-N2)-methyltransferase